MHFFRKGVSWMRWSLSEERILQGYTSLQRIPANQNSSGRKFRN
jgi:hypothetical protein